MLPSTGSRLLAIVGFLAACAAIYFSEWGVPTAPGILWRCLAGLAVICLMALRSAHAGDRRFDMQKLKSSVGEAPVRRLGNLRAAGIVLIFLAVLLAVLVAPAITDLLVRREVLVGALSVALCAIAVLAWVEIKFRAQLARAGMI